MLAKRMQLWRATNAMLALNATATRAATQVSGSCQGRQMANAASGAPYDITCKVRFVMNEMIESVNLCRCFQLAAVGTCTCAAAAQRTLLAALTAQQLPKPK